MRLALILTSLVLSSACIIRSGEIDDDSFELEDDAGGGDATAGSGGSGGAGGSGGEAPACNDGLGSGSSSSLCERLPIAGAACELDGQPADPYGELVCRSAFEVFEPGHAEELASCLSGIDAADACHEDPVVECIGRMYENSCAREDIAVACADYGAACGELGESFDTARCSWELRPLNPDALDTLVVCMEAVGGDCQARYDLCLDTVLLIE